MADKYSTIQQYQPLRVPQGWGQQEKALVVQLDETFDDIYRRFGRLRMEDMGAKFKKRIEDDEGNVSQLLVDVGQITIEVGNKYDKVSGITIDTNGIDITGNKYVKIRSGGTFDVDSTNFKISSSDKKMVSGSCEFTEDGLVFYNGSHIDENKILHIGGKTFNQYYNSIEVSYIEDNTIRYGSTNIGIKYSAKDSSNIWHDYTGGINMESASNINGVKDAATDIVIPGVTIYPTTIYSALGKSNKAWDSVFTNAIVTTNKSGNNGIFELYFDKEKVQTNPGWPTLSFIEENGEIHIRGFRTPKIVFHGVCDSPNQTTSATDYNNIMDTGNYWINIGTVTGHKPTGLTGGYALLCVNKEGQYSCMQTLYNDGEIYTRKYASGWGSWYKFTGTAV